MSEPEFDVAVPPELEAGAYAELLTNSFTAHCFTLDFIARIPELDDPGHTARAVVTARVRIPATAVLDVAEALAQEISRYELQFGEIYHPRPRGGGE